MQDDIRTLKRKKMRLIYFTFGVCLLIYVYMAEFRLRLAFIL